MISQKYNPPKVIAEIGCNHMGNFQNALELIDLAGASGVSIVKFQKRNNRELLDESQYNTPHPVLENSFGPTYGTHREFLEFTVDQHKELKKYCDQKGMVYSTSVWDVTSAREIASLKPSFIKVPSACNNNSELLRVLRDEYDGQVQISFGMTTNEEAEQVVLLFEETESAKERLLIYACTSGYPVSAEETCLLEITRLRELYGKRVADIGFSGHHLGIALDVAAYTLGATWIERHFTKDRSLKGTDHAASLEPGAIGKLVRDLNATYAALRIKDSEILPTEEIQRKKLKYRGNTLVDN
jgi:sialic acid synthase